MGLNNFEKQVQQKLSNREIKPSENSWDRLDAMLSVEEKPKNKGFFWINIAASFIVLASVGYYFYNQTKTFVSVKEEIIIVEAEEKNIENKEEKIEVRNKIDDEVLVEYNIKSEIRNQTTDNVSQITNKNQELPILNQRVSISNQSNENTVISQILNQKPTSSNRYTSAEKLLAEATNAKFESKTTENEKKQLKKRISVNPNTLISNAENEIYESYRESALEKLNKNFNSIKTVLANRNYEE